MQDFGHACWACKEGRACTNKKVFHNMGSHKKLGLHKKKLCLHKMGLRKRKGLHMMGLHKQVGLAQKRELAQQEGSAQKEGIPRDGFAQHW